MIAAVIRASLRNRLLVILAALMMAAVSRKMAAICS